MLASIWCFSAVAETVFIAAEPAGDVRNEAVVIREIPDNMDDPTFRKRLNDLASAVEREPTSGDNLASRLPLFYEYYDALQLKGVLLNWRIGTELNYAMMILNAGLRIESTRLNPKLIDHRLAELQLAEKLFGKTGRFVLEEPAEPVLQAKRYATVKLTYVAIQSR